MGVVHFRLVYSGVYRSVRMRPFMNSFIRHTSGDGSDVGTESAEL